MSISVLLSVYKSEKPAYLDRALQSVWIDQTHKPDEIVLIQDGPVGNDLKDVVSKWQNNLNQSFKLVVNEQNLGLTKSLNKGLKVATGDYIARMDSDDISTPDRLRLQKDFLDNNPGISVVGGSLQEFNSEHENLGIRYYPQTNSDALNYIYKASPLAHPSVMMRRKIFEEGFSYNENYRTSQDLALWFDLLASGHKIANIRDVIILFRRDGDLFKRRSKDKAKNELKIYINGINRLYGTFTWRYIYPIVRFCFRMMPVPVVKYIYGSRLRNNVLQ